MPELPEVQTVVTNLKPQIINQKILAIKVFWSKTICFEPDLILGQTIIDITRRGKYIIIKLTSGYLVVHLRMTGKLFAINRDQLLTNHKKHLQVAFELQDSWLLFVDQRKFGRINFCENLNWLEAKLGPEPLGQNFTLDVLTKILKVNKQIKVLLLDQSEIAGLGNIYVDEVLWQACVNPKTIASHILPIQIKLMHVAIREILQKAIDMQGTTFLSYAFDGDKKGNFLTQLKVFNRAKQACLRCDNIIIKIKVAQRGTHVCEFCQKI